MTDPSVTRPPNAPQLVGVRVVEAGSFITAPFAAAMLADLGATVTKVEPQTGDAYRRFGHCHDGLSAAWVNVNHDKKIEVLDLKSDSGASRMLELLDEADVFLHNWRPGVASSLHLDAPSILTRNSGLIHVSISGYGQSGPNSASPVFDSLLQAASGLAVLESDESRPRLLRSFVADKATALYVTQAVLAALYERTRTDRGAAIEISMLDAIAHFNFPDLFQERTFLDDEETPMSPPNQPLMLETSDGFVCIAPVRGVHLRGSVAAMGHPEWIDELKAAPSQAELVDALFRRLEPETRTRTCTQCLAAFAGEGVPAARVLTADEHLHDPQTEHNEIYSVNDSPAGPVRRVRHPAIRS